jgi:monoamine oxidase
MPPQVLEERGRERLGIHRYPLGWVFDATVTQAGPRGILQCYAGGPNARQIIPLNEEKRIQFVKDEMSRFYPTIGEYFEGGISKCWEEDPWARGASSWYKPGQMAELWPHIARPEGRIHFAGETTRLRTSDGYRVRCIRGIEWLGR